MSESELSPLRSLLPRFNKTLKKSYEGLGNTMSTYNAFVQANRRTKQEQRPNSFGLCLARRRKREA